LHLESLEGRCLLSASAIVVNETLDAALGLGALGTGVQVQAAGGIGSGPAGAADVNWYDFYLSNTAEVRLTAGPGASGPPLTATLSLYNQAPYTFDFDTFTYIDPYTPDGYRLVAQDDAGTHSGPATIDRLLGPGYYWVAVSGSGNDAFYPFLADSGLYGRTGSYQLSVATSDPGPAYDDPAVPVVLASDPAPGAVLGQSPFMLRFDLNTPVDPTTISYDYGDPGATLQLWYNTTNDFSPASTASQVDISAAILGLEPDANELDLALAAPLPGGYYEAVLQGYGRNGGNYVAPFQVAGPAGNTDPFQQPGTYIGTAIPIPNAADGQLHQVAGAVGVDPTDPVGFDPAAVQVYQFSVNGPGAYALDAEVFAGRIGSPLDAALSLFKLDAQGNPEFVAANGDTTNPIGATDQTTPLYTDPALFAALTQGQYYLVVSSGLNFPDPNDPFRSGDFDPTSPLEGGAGNSTGPYLLNLLLQPAGPAPHVVSVTPDTGPTSNGPLAAIGVRFDQPVNLLALAFERYAQTAQTGTPSGALDSVTLTDALGQSYDVRLQSYDSTTNTATFIPLDPVPPGQYTLTFSGSGPEGITNLGGVPLVGNVPGGDFVATFSVLGGVSNTLSWASQPGYDSTQDPQPIGALFPTQLSQGVTITRDTAAGAAATEDDYSLVLLQSREYSFTLNDFGGQSRPADLTFSILDSTGQVIVSGAYQPGEQPLPVWLSAGTYVLQLTWPAGIAAYYTLTVSYSGGPESPTPLVIGPGPALRVRLVTAPAGGAQPATATAPSGGTTGVVTPAGSGGSLPSVFNLPSSDLLAQGFSPLNGVAPAGGTDPAVGGERLVARALVPDTSNALLGVLIVTQAPLDNAAEATPQPTTVGAAPGVMGGLIDLSPEAVSRMLDLLFQFWGWLGAATPAPPAPTPPVEGGADDDQVRAILPGRGNDLFGSDALSEPSWGWACALAAGALVLPERLRWSRRPREERVGLVDAAFLRR
jgi:hypothetical protein